jgi:hypothetical protein
MTDLAEATNTAKPPVSLSGGSDKDFDLIDRLLADYSSKLLNIARQVGRLQTRYFLSLTVETALAVFGLILAFLVFKIRSQHNQAPYFFPINIAIAYVSATVAYVLMVHVAILWFSYSFSSILRTARSRFAWFTPRWVQELRVLGDELPLLAEQVDYLVRVASETEEFSNLTTLSRIELRLRLTETRGTLRYVREVTGIKYNMTYR